MKRRRALRSASRRPVSSFAWKWIPTRGGVHSTLSLAWARAFASHSAEAFGGSKSPVQRPLHDTMASALALHSARIAPVQPALGLVTVHSPSHLPVHDAPAES